MRKRNVLEWSKEGKNVMKDTRDIKLSEFREINEICNFNLFHCVVMAFHFGFMVGYRQKKEEEKAGEQIWQD